LINPCPRHAVSFELRRLKFGRLAATAFMTTSPQPCSVYCSLASTDACAIPSG
jgi:hypothetical protein